MREQIVTGTTALYAVLGDPVEHSLSPVFQNEGFRSVGVDAVYVALRVPARVLPEFCRLVRHTSLRGFNATIPLKVPLVEFCDELSPEARLMGAVNTVEIREGRLIGHNTDGRGFVASLREEAGFEPAGKRVVVLGAGGAARGIGWALAEADTRSVIFANRTLRRAEDLAGELAAASEENERYSACALESESLAKALAGADLLIQSTSVGMGDDRAIEVPWDSLPPKALVSDIVYRPERTPLLEEARRRGHPTLGGLGMLVYQGALSFQIWTGRQPDTRRMMEAARKALREHP